MWDYWQTAAAKSSWTHFSQHEYLTVGSTLRSSSPNIDTRTINLKIFRAHGSHTKTSTGWCTPLLSCLDLKSWTDFSTLSSLISPRDMHWFENVQRNTPNSDILQKDCHQENYYIVELTEVLEFWKKKSGNRFDWTHNFLDRHWTKFRVQQSSGKIQASTFWGAEGPLLVVWLPQEKQ